ncbi:MAG: hypothetical protein JSS76_08340 [Bacteroidetes bacterium]|nr:hypothetical protein [Bacteroidota bacterium]
MIKGPKFTLSGDTITFTKEDSMTDKLKPTQPHALYVAYFEGDAFSNIDPIPLVPATVKLYEMKDSRFTLSGDTITFTKDGSTGRITMSGESITVQQLQYNGKPGKADGLYKRMTDWYYYNHVKKSV